MMGRYQSLHAAACERVDRVLEDRRKIEREWIAKHCPFAVGDVAVDYHGRKFQVDAIVLRVFLGKAHWEAKGRKILADGSPGTLRLSTSGELPDE